MCCQHRSLRQQVEVDSPPIILSVSSRSVLVRGVFRNTAVALKVPGIMLLMIYPESRIQINLFPQNQCE